MGKYSNLSSRCECVGCASCHPHPLSIIIIIVLTYTGAHGKIRNSRRKKQMGKFVTDNSGDVYVGWWWWYIYGIYYSMYTYGKSLSFSDFLWGRGLKEKWIFRMCYFICAIWHFFPSTLTAFFSFSPLMECGRRRAPMIVILVSGSQVEGRNHRRWNGDYWHTKQIFFVIELWRFGFYVKYLSLCF